MTASVKPVIEKYYGLIDAGHLHEASGLYSEDVTLTFANAGPVYGPAAAEASIQHVLDLCTAIRHTLVTWFEEAHADGSATAFFEIRIRYDLKSGTVVDNPGAVVAMVNADGKFTEQRLYGDLTNVFRG